MTPQEVHDYKLGWKIAQRYYEVRLHSDLRRQGKEFCKVQLHPSQWDFIEYTNVYEDTFIFEYRQDAQSFAAQWPEYVNQ